MTKADRRDSAEKAPVIPTEEGLTRLSTARHKIEGDRRFDAIILENIKDSVIAIDLQGKITYWNQGAQGTFGYSSQEILGEPVSRLSHPKHKKADAATRLELMARGSSFSMEWEGRHKQGWPVFLRLTYLPMRNREGHLLGLSCVGKDITENRKAEEALRISENRYRRLFEAARDGILLLDAKTGGITSVNPYLLEMLGYTEAEMTGKKLWEIGRPKDVEASKAGFKTLQKKGFIHYEDMPLMTKAGLPFEVEVISNVYLADGSKVIQCNIRDITERKKAENSLRENEEKLTVQNALLERKNVALREIMEQSRDEKKRLQEQVQANVENLVMPVIEKIKSKGGVAAEHYTSLLEANLKEITSGFGNNISSRMLSLTQKEIDVCNMIKNGFGSKEISEALFISPRTVETHRNNIRRKLKISGQEVNLATYLKFLQ